MAADVVGTGGRTRVDGATLRARLGLLDTWAYFTTITDPHGAGGRRRESGPGGPRATACRRGSVGSPARVGAEIQIQLRERPPLADRGVDDRAPRRRAIAPVWRSAGTYRARVRAARPGPAVRVR